MIDFSNCELVNFVIHNVGNKLRDEGIHLSKEDVSFNDLEIKDLVFKYLFTPFKNIEFFNFQHPSDLKYNELYQFSKSIFKNSDDFLESSIQIAKQLYEVSVHPKIKGGELHIVYLKDCIIEDEIIDALGIFKSEVKDTYLKVEPTSNSYQFHKDSGVNISKLDKGCLIFNTEKDNGYKVAIVDNLNKGNDAKYWTNNFLNVKPANDEFHLTNNFLSITKDFVSKKLPQELGIDKTEQAELLNKSMTFFKENDHFDKNNFVENVLQEPQLIESFKEYENKTSEEHNFNIPNNFGISNDAVKKKNKVFKSVLKLDKNFHIYIHGNKSLIEKGTDTNSGKKFYKIYYDEES